MKCSLLTIIDTNSVFILWHVQQYTTIPQLISIWWSAARILTLSVAMDLNVVHTAKIYMFYWIRLQLCRLCCFPWYFRNVCRQSKKTGNWYQYHAAKLHPHTYIICGWLLSEIMVFGMSTSEPVSIRRQIAMKDWSLFQNLIKYSKKAMAFFKAKKLTINWTY